MSCLSQPLDSSAAVTEHLLQLVAEVYSRQDNDILYVEHPDETRRQQHARHSRQ